jgi:hypothetical protein
MANLVRPGQYPPEFYEIVEQVAIAGATYRKRLAPADARSLRAKWNSFLGSLHKAKLAARDREAKGLLLSAEEQRWIEHSAWADQVICVLEGKKDEPLQEICWQGRYKGYFSGLLAGMEKVAGGASAPMPGMEAAEEQLRRVMEEVAQRGGISAAEAYLGRSPQPADPAAAADILAATGGKGSENGKR